jgi:hypothetical protein
MKEMSLLATSCTRRGLFEFAKLCHRKHCNVWCTSRGTASRSRWWGRCRFGLHLGLLQRLSTTNGSHQIATTGTCRLWCSWSAAAHGWRWWRWWRWTAAHWRRWRAAGDWCGSRCWRWGRTASDWCAFRSSSSALLSLSQLLLECRNLVLCSTRLRLGGCQSVVGR